MTEPGSDATSQGLEHLQAAARELVAAFRSVLDAAEVLIDDPSAVRGAVDALSGFARRAAQQATEESGQVEHIDLG